MKIACGILILAVAALAGCVSKSQADAQAKAAYLAGEKAAYQSISASQMDIVVLGNMEKHQVPWVAGLTLGQALATANYMGAGDPQDIILKRNSVETHVDPKELLNGRDVTLLAGDVILVIGP